MDHLIEGDETIDDEATDDETIDDEVIDDEATDDEHALLMDETRLLERRFDLPLMLVEQGW